MISTALHKRISNHLGVIVLSVRSWHECERLARYVDSQKKSHIFALSSVAVDQIRKEKRKGRNNHSFIIC